MSRSTGGPPSYSFVPPRPSLSRGTTSAWDQAPTLHDPERQVSSRSYRTSHRRYPEAQTASYDTDMDHTDRSSNGVRQGRSHRKASSATSTIFVPTYLRATRYGRRLIEQYDRDAVVQQEPAATNDASSNGAGRTPPGESIRWSSMHRGVAQRIVERYNEPEESSGRMRPLPTRWSEDGKAAGLEISGDGSVVRLHTSVKAVDEAACLRTDHSIPKEVGIYYYEVEIKSRGKEVPIGIGLSSKGTTLTRPPGWETGSYAYHGDDGCVYPGVNAGHMYGPKFSTGDVVGCGINFRTNSIFFTRNGVFLGKAFPEVKTDRLYPTIGLRKSNDHLHVNFGQHLFVYDIGDMVRREQATVRHAINATNISKLYPPDDETTLLRRLIGQYLAHEGYVGTSKAFAGDLQARQKLAPSEKDSNLRIHDETDDLHASQRQCIRSSVLEGKIDNAVSYLEQQYPAVLKQDREVYFKLRCRKFIETVREYSEQQARDSEHTNGDDLMTSTQMELDEQLHREASNGTTTRDDVQTEATTGTLSKKRMYAEQRNLEAEVLEYGQELRLSFDADPEFRPVLDNMFALMAYPNPADSPLGDLLDTSGRAEIAEDLNSAILVSLGKPSSAALERLCVQTTAFLALTAAKVGGSTAFVDIEQDLLGP